MANAPCSQPCSRAVVAFAVQVVAFAVQVVALLALALPAHAQSREQPPSPGGTVYVSPGVVYAGFDRPNGNHGVGAELSVPWGRGRFAVGPFSQLLWTPKGLHYIAGAELVYSLFAVELGYFGHGNARHGKQGFSGALLVGAGYGWLGPRLSVAIDGTISVAFNISLKVPLAVHGCHWYTENMVPGGCKRPEQE